MSKGIPEMIAPAIEIMNKAGLIFSSIMMKQLLFSTIVFVIIMPVLYFIRKRSVYLQYTLLALFFIRLCLPPNLSHAFSGASLFSRYFTLNRLNRSMSLFAENEDRTRQTESETASAFSTRPVWLQRLHQIRLTSWLMLMWFSSAAAFLILYLDRLNQIRHLIKNSEIIHDRTMADVIRRWKTKYRIKRKITLLKLDQKSSPFTTGLLRPKICLPADLLRTRDLTLIEAVLAHEMAHIVRLDYLWLKIQDLIKIIYFFNPMVWAANSRFHVLRECICDHMVLSRLQITPEKYGSGLLAIMKFHGNIIEDLHVSPCFGQAGNKIRFRIEHLKKDRSMSKKSNLVALSAVVLLGSFILPMAAKNPIHAEMQVDKTVKSSKTAEKTAVQFILPIENGKIVSGWGMRKHPFTGEMQLHKGLDIAAARGIPVLASADGRVIQTDYLPETYGRLIRIQHSGHLTTLYAQLDTILVSEGQELRQGEKIGLVGSSGRSTGPHLHFELRVNDEAVNPESYIQGN